MFRTNSKIFIIGYIGNSNPWFCCWQSDFCMTLKNGFDKCSYLFYHPQMNEKIKTRTLRFPAKGNPNKETALFNCPIVLQYDIKAKYRLISRKFSGMTFFHPSVRLTNQKPRAFLTRLYPFDDKPIKSPFFYSFVASVLFARFHFRVIRKIALFLLYFISLVGIPDAQPITSQISEILCRWDHAWNI